MCVYLFQFNYIKTTRAYNEMPVSMDFVVVGGTNKKYCIGQVQVFKFKFKSLS